jgi:hypothetical protein
MTAVLYHTLRIVKGVAGHNWGHMVCADQHLSGGAYHVVYRHMRTLVDTSAAMAASSVAMAYWVTSPR